MTSPLRAFPLLGAFLLPLAIGCSAAPENADQETGEGALTQTDRFAFDPASTKERAGEVDIKNAYSAARLAKLVYQRWADDNELKKNLTDIGVEVTEVWPFYAPLGVTRMFTGTDGFYLRTPNVAFLVFRGTEPDKSSDMFADARALGTRAGGKGNRSSEGKMHEGFYHSLQAVWDEVRPKLVERHGKDNKVPLYIVGHSLGGALATVAAHQLLFDGCLKDGAKEGECEKSYIPVAGVYSWGSPRTGDEPYATNLAKRFQETDTKFFRFVNEGDGVSMIPRYVPLPIVNPYRHIGEGGDERSLAIFLDKGGKMDPKPTGHCSDNPAMVQCDPSATEILGGMIFGHPFWKGEHSMDIYLAKMKSNATGEPIDLDKMRKDLEAAGRY